MLQTRVYYKYYRNIPKDWRAYVRSESMSDNYRNGKKCKGRAWTASILKAAHSYRRKSGFEEYILIGVPPSSTGGVTECHIEVTDTVTNRTVIFVGRVKCSRKDVFSYIIGRGLALKEARESYDRWVIKTEIEKL